MSDKTWQIFLTRRMFKLPVLCVRVDVPIFTTMRINGFLQSNYLMQAKI